MKLEALKVLARPACKSSLNVTAKEQDGREVTTGQLECSTCHLAYPIVRGVPRFVGAESYARSFGRQWNWFRAVQLDSRNAGEKSERQRRFRENRFNGIEISDGPIRMRGVKA